MDDIIIGDIINHNVTSVQNKKKIIVKEKEKRHMWHCGWSMSPISPTTVSHKCHPEIYIETKQKWDYRGG